MGREGFEPSKAEPADLQSAPFGRSGTDPQGAKDIPWCGATVSACPPSTSSPKSTCRKSATRSTRPTARPPPGSTSRAPTPRSSSRDKELVLTSSTDDRLRALYQVLQEKLVKREVSLKSFDVGKVEEASRGSARQRLAIQAGISSDHAKKINKFIKDLGLKGVSSQTQGDQLRVSGKKRDDLQAVIAACKAEDFGIPLQFENFRD